MLIYRNGNATIHQTSGRIQPYAVWKDGKIEGFEADYGQALRRLAKATQDKVMLKLLEDDGIIRRVPQERKHRPLATPRDGAYRRLR